MKQVNDFSCVKEKEKQEEEFYSSDDDEEVRKACVLGDGKEEENEYAIQKYLQSIPNISTKNSSRLRNVLRDELKTIKVNFS